MSNALDFSTQVVLVTGGSRGVGRGITEAFLNAGAEVAICGRNAPEDPPSGSGKEAVFLAPMCAMPNR